MKRAVHTEWPTDHHDYRRTGFTLLKGDVNKASDIDASNIALKDSVISDIVIRPSVSDLDNNGHQDVVTVIHPVERRDRILNRWWMNTNQRWHLSIPTSYPLLPPTLANIDSDSQKEVLVGLRNGTLIAYDISGSGDSATEKWRYKFSGKYTAVGGTTIIDFGGGTAVTDIDLDGNNEVITADFGTRTAYDWPGEVYVIDGATGAKEGNATFGNGGAFASLFITKTGGDAL
ncbi:PQQ-like beta-propeller repeat protein [Candidatus Woesearchaeota archaeon]|nr:PQQ-like beta-propeller repeat protein [Candidatus Woesearchaeota archaeon]